MCFANTYGIILAIILLGYGLVELPRFLWQLGSRELQFRHALVELSQTFYEQEFCKEQILQTANLLDEVEQALRIQRNTPEEFQQWFQGINENFSAMRSADLSETQDLRKSEPLAIAKVLTNPGFFLAESLSVNLIPRFQIFHDRATDISADMLVICLRKHF